MVSIERRRRALSRWARRRAFEVKSGQAAAIDLEIQGELDRLTDENAQEVRARLRELHRKQEESRPPVPVFPSVLEDSSETLRRLGSAAWEQAAHRDEELAHRWEAALYGRFAPEARAFLESERKTGQNRAQEWVGIEMLWDAISKDREAKELFARIRRMFEGADARHTKSG